MRIKKHIALIILFLSAVVCSGAAGTFPISVNDSSGLDSPWPLITGIPFPKGEIKDSSTIRIMSGSSEIPSQVDVAATWHDGSIRWILAGFTSSPQGNYMVEYGTGIKRKEYPNPLKVDRQADGGFTVDTGAAVYQFDADKLLPENAWLVSGGKRISILKGSGAGAYLVDNSGRMARVSGQAAEIENRFLKEGPGRIVLKRSGWYVTQQGEKLAKADIWIYLAAGTPYLRITHSIVFTQDTNKVWFKDYGLEFKTPSSPADVYCAMGEQGKEEVRKVTAGGNEVYLLQDSYPHFAERESKGAIGRSAGGRDAAIENIEMAGDWAYGDYGSYGITLVMPWLAERFPKEISFGPGGARAVLWSGRSGRELDFRAKTIVKEYLQEWATVMFKNPGEKELDAVKSNAQGAARTHDIWFLPTAGGYGKESVEKPAAAASRPPLVMADTVWTCKTEAMGYPMLHKDTKQFPKEEVLLSEYWTRFILPLVAFPMNGYMAWGCYPDRSYGFSNGKAMSQFQVISSLREYGVRREPWRLYARSGERRYYDWGYRFSRFTGDWYLIHADAPGKSKGAFIPTKSGGGLSARLPLFWGEGSWTFIIDAGDIGHWLLDYYLTGDERSLDLLYMIKESFKKNGWRLKGEPAQFHATGIRSLVTLMIMDWDEDAVKAAKETVNELVDLKSQNGVRIFELHYGSQYKDMRTSHNVLEYYLETGDELAKTAFLKLIDQRYRFDRRYRAVAYKNYDAFTYSIAYWMTGDERYRTVAEQAMRDMLYYNEHQSLSEALAQKPKNIFEWPNIWVNPIYKGPRTNMFLGHHEYHNPFIGIPTVLKLVAEKGWSGKTTPLMVKPTTLPEGKILFMHEKGKETQLNVLLITKETEIKPAVSSYTGNITVEGITAEKEQQMSSGPYFKKRPKEFPPSDRKSYYVSITVPGETASGLYLLSFAEEDTFTLLDTNSKKSALYCPEGFWSVSIGEHSGEKSYGRSGEGMPAFFRVPDNLKELEIFMGRPARIKSPDGSIAIEWSNNNIGKIKVPAEGKGGIWSVDYHIYTFTGISVPVFIRLLNVEPVVAFGSPALLPESSGRLPEKPQDVPAPAAPMEFVAGISGKAARLSGSRTLTFDRGEKIAKGGYANFPGTTGTVEFWFKADRNTWEIPMEMMQTINNTFLKGPHIVMLHSYYGLAHFVSVNSSLMVRLMEKGKAVSPTGFEGDHFFRAGRWTHIAYTWDIKKGASNMEGILNIFVDGKKIGDAGGRSAPYPIKPLENTKIFELADEGEKIEIGPFDGTMDMLRISDNVRYAEDFAPSRTAPAVDANTRALFLFDGNLRGTSALSGIAIEAK